MTASAAKSIAIALALALAICAPMVFSLSFSGMGNETFAAQATVMVSDDEGHGSGVVIARGLVLTAAHVVGTNPSMKITLSTGSQKIGHILWTGRDHHDIALIEVDTDAVTPARIDCRRLKMGGAVFTFGHPVNVRNVVTWGRIASDTVVDNDEAAVGSVLMDMTVLPGNSGGGVWESDGRLVGLADAVLAVPSGFGASLTGLSVMVSSPVLCLLLGRIAK